MYDRDAPFKIMEHLYTGKMHRKQTDATCYITQCCNVNRICSQRNSLFPYPGTKPPKKIHQKCLMDV